MSTKCSSTFRILENYYKRDVHGYRKILLCERQMHMTIKEVNVFGLLQQRDRDEDHFKEKVWGFIEVDKQRSHIQVYES